MNEKFFKRYIERDHYWETISVVSDGEITPDPTWKEAEGILNPVVALYQCHNPEICVKEYMRKQEMADILREQLDEIKAEQSVLKGLLASKMPCNQPVLFDDIIATMDDEGTVVFQMVIHPGEL